MGVSTQGFGSLCHWLINAINILTGNFDEAGGAMFTAPAFDISQRQKAETFLIAGNRAFANLPEFMGELPVAALAEEIETDGDGQIKALVTSCGNPVLSTPNGSRLNRALEKLEFMVSIDIYINETTRNASNYFAARDRNRNVALRRDFQSVRRSQHSKIFSIAFSEK